MSCQVVYDLAAEERNMSIGEYDNCLNEYRDDEVQQFNNDERGNDGSDSPGSEHSPARIAAESCTRKKDGDKRWSSPTSFILSCIGFSIGYGNLWRFPCMAYRNGGGSFLIAYLVSVLLGSVPMFLLEILQGQFTSRRAIKTWKIAPIFEGIGYSSLLISFCVNCYYNMVATWSLRYMFASFLWPVPAWASCDNSWNSEHCVDTYQKSKILPDGSNITAFSSSNNFSVPMLKTDPAVEYWEHRVLDMSASLEDVTKVKWDLFVCLALTWIIVFVFLLNDTVQSSGRILHYMATVPLLFLLFVMIRGITLSGALQGLAFFLKPDLPKLLDPSLWADAGMQAFFSYSIGMGILGAQGSTSPARMNLFPDTLIFACTDVIASLISGFAVFPVLGHIAELRNVAIEEAVENGPGVVFIAFSKALASMPVLPPVCSLIFFAAFAMVGIISQFCAVESFVKAITDFLPRKYLKQVWFEAIVLALVCIVKFSVGLIMVTNAGVYVVYLIDYFSVCRITVLVAVVECIAVGWIYGCNKFYKNIEVFWGRTLRPSFRVFLIVMWRYVTPVYCLVLFCFNIYHYCQMSAKNVNSGIKAVNSLPLPQWAINFAWGLAYYSVVFIPLAAVVKICRKSKTMTVKQRITHLSKPILKKHMILPDVSDDSYIADKSGSDDDEEETIGDIMLRLRRVALAMDKNKSRKSPVDVLDEVEEEQEQEQEASGSNQPA